MGALIGSSVGVSTWGKFRCAMILNDDYSSGGIGFTASDNNIEYLTGVDGVKSAASGSGLIRYPRFTQSANFAQQPSIFSVFSASTGNRLIAIPGSGALGFQVPTEVRTQLEGQTVTLTGLSATLTSTFFTTGVQVIGGGSPAQPITAIGNLAAL